MNMMALAAVITSSADDSLNLTIMVTMILMTVILPSSLLITFIIALVGWLILRKNTERAYLFMMRTFRRGAKVFLIVLALGLLDSSIRMSFGIIMALLACMAGFVFCGIASRFKYHTPVGKKYLNIVQISSLVKVAAFFGCYICTAKSGILGKYTAVLSKDFLKNIFSKDYGQEFLEQYLFMLGALVVIIALCVTLFSLMGTLSRLGGMLPRNKETGILSSIMSAVLIAVPAIESTTDWRISLDNGQKSLLVIAATFTFVMIVSDISIKFLRYLTCPDLRETEKDSILRGLQAVETELFDEPEKDLTDEEVEEAYKIFQAQKHLG